MRDIERENCEKPRRAGLQAAQTPISLVGVSTALGHCTYFPPCQQPPAKDAVVMRVSKTAAANFFMVITFAKGTGATCPRKPAESIPGCLRGRYTHPSGHAGSWQRPALLVTLLPDVGGLALGGFLLDAQDLLGRRVDVITEAALHPAMRDHVLATSVALRGRPCGRRPPFIAGASLRSPPPSAADGLKRRQGRRVFNPPPPAPPPRTPGPCRAPPAACRPACRAPSRCRRRRRRRRGRRPGWPA